MQVRNVQNYSIKANQSLNKNVQAKPAFTAAPHTMGVFDYKMEKPAQNILQKIKQDLSKFKKHAEITKKPAVMTPEAKTIYDNVQKKCDGSFSFFSPKKSPVLQKMANFYRNEEITAARLNKKA